MLNGYLWCIISSCDSGWSCRGELFITVFAMIDESGKGWHESLCKKIHKIEEKIESFHYLCALKGKKSGGTDIASIVEC